jgi:uncharacterized membrane protein YhaH (DUF805 family)
MLIEYFKVVVFQKYATFSGRARRSEFWYFVLANFIIGIILGVIDNVLGTNNYLGERNGLLGFIYSLLTIIPNLALGVRRLHDIGKSGWFLLLMLIPIVFMGVIEGIISSTGFDLRFLFIFGGLALLGLAIYFIVLYATEGNKGTNKFGPDPKNPEYTVEDHLID